jgi:lysophospholipase L1-like esterase
VTVYAFSRLPAFNPNTNPASVAKSATGSVYDIGDTGFLTPLNLTLVATNTVTTTLISDANGMFPDFTLVDRTQCAFKSGTQVFILTTTTPIPGPASTVAGPAGPAGPATTDASLMTAGTLADARLPATAQAATLSSTYAPASGSANYAPKTTATVQGLPAWARKRMLATLAQGPCRVLCVGDSTTAGVYSDSYTTATGSANQGGPNSYPAQLAKRLTAMGIPAEYSFCLPGHGGNDDSRWSLGTWGYAAYGAGMNAAITSATAGQTATVTPTNVANTYIVYFFGDSGTGVFTAQATGGVSVSINTVETTAGIYGSAVVTASATASTNTITFTNTSGTVFVVGVESSDSANPNKVRIMGAGVGGSKATVWNNTSGPGALNFIKGIAPDLTIISLGVNDGAVPDTTANVLAAVNSIAATAAASGDVLLMSAVPHDSVTAVDGYNAAYKGTGKPYADLQARWGNKGPVMGLMTTDNTHPNALGYGDMATLVANTLTAAP